MEEARVNAAAEELARGLDKLVDVASEKHFQEARRALAHAADSAQDAAKNSTHHHERALLNGAGTIAADSCKLLDSSREGGPNVEANLKKDTQELNNEVGCASKCLRAPVFVLCFVVGLPLCTCA